MSTRALAALLALSLSGCAGLPITPSPLEALADGQAYPAGNPYRLLAVEELPIVGAQADSEKPGYGVSRMIDGNLSTQWVSGQYRAAEAWAQASLASVSQIQEIQIKTGPLASGVTYEVQVSEDGSRWATVLSGQRNTSWNLERKSFAAAAGRYVRVRFHNTPSASAANFSIFELVVGGTGGGGGGGETGPVPPPVAPNQLAPTQLSASSTYSGLNPGLAADGREDTQWASGEYKSGSEWLRLDFGHSVGFDTVAIKTGYLPEGVSYTLEASADGAAWTPLAVDQRNTSWKLETKAASGQGRYLRVRFTNDAAAPIARFMVYEIQAFGRTSPQAVSRELLVRADTHRASFGPSACINGSWQQLIQVEAGAFNNAGAGLRFPAMLGFELERLGRLYGRITPENASQWSGDLGGCGSVSFLDSEGGISDNAGAWTFTHRDANDEIYPITAEATREVTTWSPARSAQIDLGAEVRRWRIDSTNLDPNGAPNSHGVILVYTRPDGTRDFAIAHGPAYPPGSGPVTIETRGILYAFFLGEDASSMPSADVRLRFSSQL